MLGLGPRGIFIPYRLAGAISARRPPYKALEAVFDAARPRMRLTLERTAALARDLDAIGQGPDGARWDQDWFPRLDAAVLYAMVRHLKPKTVIEIGAGHSTRFIARAVADGGLTTRHVALDPWPRAVLPQGVERVATTLQATDPNLFRGLGPGDILFIDSSHVLVPGSDVDIIVNDILPLLPAGTMMHVHDIFLPDGYPSDWHWRGYNEQTAVAVLLQGRAYEIVFSSRYATTRLADDPAVRTLARLPIVPGAWESSLWIEKRTCDIP
ncbi:MAG: class I SAM-dependent methyltransferase [Alphaproteobacteria bacterium]